MDNYSAIGNKETGGHKEPRLRISTKRLWLFRIITALVIPALILVLIEAVLRAAGYGYPAAALIKYQIDGSQEVYCSNPRFGWRFFPPKIAQEISPFAVPADKAENTYRIFILGGSAAQGEPDPAYGFGRQLRFMLRQLYPSVNFEVYNAAIPGINSHVAVQIAKDCARLEPDLFIVYMGNNEVIGPYGAGTLFSPLTRNLSLIRMGIAIKGTKTGQLMNNLIGTIKRGGVTTEAWGSFDMFFGRQVRYDDEQMKFVYSHFRQNLEDISRFARESGAKTIFSTVPVNLKDCSPLGSLHRQNTDKDWTSFENLYSKGVGLEKAGDYTGAVESYLAAAETDDTYAALQFRLGRCFWNLGQFEKAHERYELALELDTLRFRADSKINNIIREVAEDKTDRGIYFADAVGVFEQNSPNNCPGYELFLEHVHLNFEGNYLLARTLLNRLNDALPESIKSQKSEDREPPDEDECAERLAFTDYDNFTITRNNFKFIRDFTVFENQAYRKKTIESWKNRTELLEKAVGPDAAGRALKQYEKTIKRYSSDSRLRLKYARLLWSSGRKTAPGAIEQYRVLIKQIPNSHKALGELAYTENMVGDNDTALKHAAMAADIMPTNILANYIIAAVLQAKNRPMQAQKQFAKTIRMDPKCFEAYIGLGSVLDQQGKDKQAEEVYRKGIEEMPNNANLHFNLAVLLRNNGAFEDAKEELRKAMILDPGIAARL